MHDLSWGEVTERFGAARNWWVSTAGTGGPHAVPVWGVVVDDVLSFYGSPAAVRSKNMEADQRVVLHLEDAEDPLILQGRAIPTGLAKGRPDLIDAYRRKYQGKHDKDYLLSSDYASDAISFEVHVTKALAWTVDSAANWRTRRWVPDA